MADLMLEVRCRGCWRQLGVSKEDRVIYCDMRCATDFPATATEARDALVEAVYLTRKPTFGALGEMFGFSRQHAQQIVARRDLRKAA